MPFVPQTGRSINTNPGTPAQLRATLAKLAKNLAEDASDIDEIEQNLLPLLRLVKRYSVADEAMTAGDVVYVTSEGHIGLADASDAAKYEPAGIILQDCVAGQTVLWSAGGVVKIEDWGLTPDRLYFLDASTPGGLVLTPVDAEDNAAIIVGKALSAEELLVAPGPGYIL